jgi:hypothetical protein
VEILGVGARLLRRAARLAVQRRHWPHRGGMFVNAREHCGLWMRARRVFVVCLRPGSCAGSDVWGML